MAESSKVKMPGIHGSDEVSDIFCEMCLKDGTKSEAYAFCVDCTEYFCSTCLKYHKKFLKDHVMLEGDSMPTDAEKCPFHDETIKFYCMTCNLFACKICKTNHKLKSTSSKAKCKVSLVSELSKNIEDRKEFKDFIKNCEKVKSKSAELTQSMQALQSVATRAKQEVQKVKQTIFETAEQIESDIEKRENNDRVHTDLVK